MAMPELRLARRSLAWRTTSAAVMGLTGALSRAFLYGLNSVQTEGLGSFLKILDERRAGRNQQGLLTVANHVSVLDDPLIWGILPLKYAFDPVNLRWSLGAHDICFKNQLTRKFFSLGQVFPTHRLLHSPYGGVFQPTMDEAVRVLSRGEPTPSSKPPSLTFTTRAGETYPSPSAYDDSRNAWVHVFPEACVHQHPDLALRYFKWGVSRLILESNPAPRLVPMFIDGNQHIMHESRKAPRWLPRIGYRVHVIFGDAVDTGQLFGEARDRWAQLVREQSAFLENSADDPKRARPSYSKALETHAEAIQLRIRVAEAVRSQVVSLRKKAGYPDDDPIFAKAETWKREPNTKKFKSPVDGSMVHRE